MLLYPMASFSCVTLCTISLLLWCGVDVIQTKKLRDEHSDDMSVMKAFTLVLEKRPDLRLASVLAAWAFVNLMVRPRIMRVWSPLVCMVFAVSEIGSCMSCLTFAVVNLIDKW